MSEEVYVDYGTCVECDKELHDNTDIYCDECRDAIEYMEE